jgi:endonuclease-3
METDTMLPMPAQKPSAKPLKKSAKKSRPAPKPAATAKRAAKSAKKSGPAKRSGAARKPPSRSAGRTPARASAKSSSQSDLSSSRINDLLSRLQAAYPDAECALHHRNAWELLVATILSAQCTDARVNMVTPELFRRFPTPAAFAQASLPAIEEEIRSTGFYHNKAKSLSGAAKRLVAEFGGKVPETMNQLLTLPGVARKTANVVLGVAFHKAEGVVVDTHVLRISGRLGLTQSDQPKQVEQDLMQVIPRDRWISFSHEIIHHGRRICVARRPKCAECSLETLCQAPDKTWTSH